MAEHADDHLLAQQAVLNVHSDAGAQVAIREVDVEAPIPDRQLMRVIAFTDLGGVRFTTNSPNRTRTTESTEKVY